MRRKPRLYTCCITLLLLASGLSAQPLFDTHLHYDAEDAAQFTPRQIIDILQQNDILHAAVTSRPPRLAKQLHEADPDRIMPLLGIYQDAQDKHAWVRDTELPAWLEAEMEQGAWAGIGELHLFADDRLSPVFRRIVELAGEHKLPLLLHTDPAVIDTVYEIAPQQPIIWAHAGTYPYPDLLADYLKRYPSLSIDLSVRDERIAPNGELRDEWYMLFLAYPERFMIGVDTFSTNRWHHYAQSAEAIREWINQLPDNVAERLTHLNAAILFNRMANE